MKLRVGVLTAVSSKQEAVCVPGGRFQFRQQSMVPEQEPCGKNKMTRISKQIENKNNVEKYFKFYKILKQNYKY